MDSINLKITVQDKSAKAILLNNPTSRDFASLLPLTLKMEDYANTEKITNLPKKLTTHNAPKGYAPIVGDLTYYTPWGNLALFYKNFSFSNGLIHLGRIIQGIELFKQKDSFIITIELDQ